MFGWHMMKLQGTETIRDVVHMLDNAEDYARGVFGNMADFRKRQIDPAVQIGSTGQGIVPHYRIKPAASGNSFHSDLDDIGEYFKHVAAFNGRNHKDMEWGAFNFEGNIGVMALCRLTRSRAY